MLGALFGIFVFGETVDTYDRVVELSGYFGRLTLHGLARPARPEWWCWRRDLMALFMFWGAEKLEGIFGGKDPKKAPRLRYAGRSRPAAWGAGSALHRAADHRGSLGEPRADQRRALLAERQVQIHPGELLATTERPHPEPDHARRARRSRVQPLPHRRRHPGAAGDHPRTGRCTCCSEPANTIIVVMSNDEERATQAWKTLIAESVPNVYILEGGINSWLDTFAAQDSSLQRISAGAADSLRYAFPAALGARYPAATPDPHEYELEYTPKIKLDVNRGPGGGGCGNTG